MSRVRIKFFFVFFIVSCSLSGCTYLESEHIVPGDTSFEGIPYSLPKGIVKLKIEKNGSTPLSFTIEDIIYREDPNFQFAINIRHNIFYNDKIKITTTSNNLLDKISTTVRDETPAIFEKIATGIQNIAQISSSNDFKIVWHLDPTDKNDVYKLHKAVEEIPQADYDFRVINLAPQARAVVDVDPADCYKAICFRPVLPYALELHEKVGTHRIVSRQIVSVPNESMIGLLKFKRAPFVEKKFDADFDNGILVDLDLENPSEVLEFTGIPISIAKIIVAIPSAIFNFQIKQVRNDTAHLKAQTDNLNQQRQLISAQQQLLEQQSKAFGTISGGGAFPDS